MKRPKLLAKFSKFHLVAAFIIVALVGTVFAKISSAAVVTYYVSPTGSNSNDGLSPSTAWQTIDYANTHNFAPGEVLAFEGGNTFIGTIYFGPGESGTSTNPIKVQSYGTGKATISASGAASAFYANDSAGIEIDNLQFAGPGVGTSTAAGISFFNDLAGNVKLGYVRVSNVESKNFMQGMSIGGNNGTSGYDDVIVSDSNFHDNRDAGLTSYGPAFNAASPNYANSNITVTDVLAYNNLGNVNNTTSNSGNGVVLGSVNTGHITRSRANNNGGSCSASECGAGLWTYDSTGMTLDYNEAYSNDTASTADGDGFDLDQNVSNSIVQYNYSHNNEGAGFLVYSGKSNSAHSNNTVRYNISQNDGLGHGYAGIWVGGSAGNNEQIYNNTIYTDTTSANNSPAIALYSSSGSGIYVRNNIIDSGNGQINIKVSTGATSRATFQGNDYYSTGTLRLIWGSTTYNTLSDWRTATNQEKNGSTDTGFSVDPLLNGPGTGGNINNPDNLKNLTAYKVSNSSPMINAGLNLNTLFGINAGSKDFYGTNIPQSTNYDIGAYEKPASK